MSEQKNYIEDNEIRSLIGENKERDFELIGGDGSDIDELGEDIKKMEKMLKAHEQPTSILWIVPTVFTEWYHDAFGKKVDEDD